ncbi:MAG TPA: hypothetical protein DCQ64_20255 [Candidatus Rokubacteria bacterium]|nr:hypothetical protein [Candidatus Rokubacteria bacterium]
MRIQSNVGCEVRDACGAVVTAWQGSNIATNNLRQSFINRLLDQQLVATAVYPRFFHFGTGTAVPVAAATQIGTYVTAKATAASSALGTSGLTARLYASLGPTEMTGTITELGAAASEGPGSVLLFAWSLVDGGTGVSHASGTQAIFYWDFVLGTGQQPF